MSMPHRSAVGSAGLCFVLQVTTGIGLGCGHPLEEGTYSFSVDQMKSNSCVTLDGNSVGIGDVDLLQLAWVDEDTFSLSNGANPKEYEVDDQDQVSRSQTTTEELDGACKLRVDATFEGTIDSTTQFSTLGAWELSAEGWCDGVAAAEEFPCSLQFTTSCVKVE